MLRTDGDPELRVFDPVIRFLHWLSLFLVATIFVLAFSIDFASSKGEAVALIDLHRSLGVTVWVLTLGRLIWRQFSRFPNWPADMPQAMRFAAQWTEYALYAVLLAQPIFGLLQTNAHGDRVNLFFLGHLPGADRPAPPAREAAPGGARDSRAPSPRSDCAPRFGGALPPLLAPRRHARGDAAAGNEASVRA
jgi:cytochrome b561